MKKLLTIIAGAVVLISCGQRHQAKGVIGDFLDRNLKEEFHYSKDFGRLDSTRRLSDSIVGVLRTTSERLPQFKKGIDYGNESITQPLVYVRVKLYQHDDTTNLTFYLDKDITRVVAFKEN